MPRAILVVLDSVGAGGAPDAEDFFNGELPDTGANTLGHLAEVGPLRLPNLDALGLGAAVRLASGARMPGFDAEPAGLWGAAEEISPGKDTPSGHWELAGLSRSPGTGHYFPDIDRAQLSRHAGLVRGLPVWPGPKGILGNRHSSRHRRSSRTSLAHEHHAKPAGQSATPQPTVFFRSPPTKNSFGLERLLSLCAANLRRRFMTMKVGRVIARPFVGQAGAFERTGQPPRFCDRTTCADLVRLGVRRQVIAVHAVGKIKRYLFRCRGIDRRRQRPQMPRSSMDHLGKVG